MELELTAEIGRKRTNSGSRGGCGEANEWKPADLGRFPERELPRHPKGVREKV